MNKIQLTNQIPLECARMRIDQVLAELFPEHSRARLTKWLKNNQVTINGEILKPKVKVRGGETIIIDAEIEESTQWQAQNLALEIIYEDECLIVINKPAGLVVHPAAGNPDNTLVNALLHHCPTLQQIPRAGLVHRLDKDTTGLLVVTKTLTAHTAIVSDMQQRKIKREYQAIAHGTLNGSYTINAPIARHPKNRLKMAVIPSGKRAVTRYQVHAHYKNFTHLNIELETGRTHQIRVHMAHIHHPIVGDILYGGKCGYGFARQALHAYRLTSSHPQTGETMQWTIDLPDDMKSLIENISNEQ